MKELGIKPGDKLQVQTYNWGPCVIRFKITEKFKKLLLEEAKEATKDYRENLAGQLDKELGYSDESKNKALPFVSQYLGIYDQMFQQFRNKAYDKKPEYFMSSMWINFQRQYEFNPPHDHDGCLSFVIYLSIPEKLKKEHAAYKGKSAGPGGIQFIYGEGGRDCVTYMSHFPEEGDMFIFPAWLKHWVSPYKSDVVRVSVSGNIHNSAPLNQIKKGELIGEEDEEYIKELKNKL
tara:strand:+ start:442 stop:1143 length:702 start_codon:yes stop_codon:yes gene_type:complete